MKDVGMDYPYNCLGRGHSCGSKLMGEEEEKEGEGEE
jgi:hypothetical protein